MRDHVLALQGPRRVAIASFALVLASGGIPPAIADPALTVHIVPATYSGCESVDELALTCDQIVAEGDNASIQFAFVVATDVSAIAGVQFGVAHELGSEVLDWTLCTGGLQIPEASWPDSGSALAATWPSVHIPGNSDDNTLVGFFTIDAGASGTMTLTPDARIGRAEYSDELYLSRPFSVFGTGDIGGGGNGVLVCSSSAQGASSQAPLLYAELSTVIVRGTVTAVQSEVHERPDGIEVIRTAVDLALIRQNNVPIVESF